jgi:phosphonatase-like hydrolase
VLEHAAGKEKLQAMIDVLAATGAGEESRRIAERAFAAFKPALKQGYQEMPIRSFGGVDGLLRELRRRGVKVVLNTGYDRFTAETLLSKVGWQVGRDVDGLVTADDVRNGRPHPDMIERAMALCDIDDPACVLKAGDSVVDIQEGKNAGCGVTVGVLTGAQTRQQLALAAPTYVLDSVADLKDLDIF